MTCLFGYTEYRIPNTEYIDLDKKTDDRNWSSVIAAFAAILRRLTFMPWLDCAAFRF